MTAQDDARSEDAFLKGAYGLTDLGSAMEFYSEWAGEYDDRMESVLGYVAPRLMADMFADTVTDTSQVILDVGCGTGLTSHYLTARGFTTVDGVDLNPAMIDRARERGIYRDLIEADITLPIDLPTASYDGIISSGTFTLGHVGPEPIPELVRMLKPGGVLGCTVHREIWAKNGFQDQFTDFEADGVLTTLARSPGEFFKGFGDTAYYCLFRKS